MSKEIIFKELIEEMAKDGKISSSEYTILLEKGKDLGFSKKAIDLLIKLELTEFSDSKYTKNIDSETHKNEEEERYTFKSAITRGGSLLTPDIIIIDSDSVTYKRRNKYFINVDSITIQISKISSIQLDTSLWGTDIIIKSFGAGEIIAKKFSKSDAEEVRKLIRERQ